MAKKIINANLTVILLVLVGLLAYNMVSNAGLNPSAPPAETMKTMQDVYDAVIAESSGISQRDPLVICKSAGAGATVNLLTVPAGKRFVLLKWYNQDSRFSLYVNDTTFLVLQRHFSSRFSGG